MDPISAGPLDLALKLLAGATYTASANGAPLDLDSTANFSPPSGGMPMLVEVPVTAITFAGNAAATVKHQDSPDGSTWTDRSPSVPIPSTAGRVVFGTFVTAHAQRLVVTVTGAGSNTTSLTLGDAFLKPFVNSPG